MLRKTLQVLRRLRGKANKGARPLGMARDPTRGCLERVVVMSSLTAQDCGDRSDQVGRNQKRPPPLVLPDVYELVREEARIGIVHAQYDVAECDGPESPPQFPRPGRALA